MYIIEDIPIFAKCHVFNKHNLTNFANLCKKLFEFDMETPICACEVGARMKYIDMVTLQLKFFTFSTSSSAGSNTVVDGNLMRDFNDFGCWHLYRQRTETQEV